VRRIDRQVAGEGAAKGLVGRDQGAQAFVDLAVGAFTPLLDGEHHQQPDADAEEGEKGEPDQGREQAVP
jgi:hypothetical protein